LSEMALPRLSLPGTRSLVRGLAPGGIRDVDLSALADRAWRASAGNPFVAVEVVRALQEGTSPPVDEALSLPRRVRDLLLGRVERVGDLGRDLLNTAAVIGVDDFPFALLRHAADLDDRRAAAGLEELVRRGLAHAGGDGFHLLHEQVRDVVYEQLPPERRSLLHA